jgi:hypothetical protein
MQLREEKKALRANDKRRREEEAAEKKALKKKEVEAYVKEESARKANAKKQKVEDEERKHANKEEKRARMENAKKRKAEDDDRKEAEKKKVLGVSAAERTLQLNDPTLHSCSLCGIIIPCFSRLSGLVRHTETFHPEKREFISSLKMALKEQQEETKRLKAKKRSAKRKLR